MRTTWQNQIILSLVNSVEQEELLKTVPHRYFMDMVVVYGTLEQLDKQTIRYRMITNDVMKAHRLTEERLYEFALENTPRLMPFKIKTGEKMLEQMWESICEEELPQKLRDWAPECYFLTNEYWYFGASAFLFKEVFDELAERLGGDLHILPLSRHELFVLKAGAGDVETLANDLRARNDKESNRSIALSDQIYQYDRTKREFSQLTDFPERAFTEKRKKEVKKGKRMKGTAR